MDQKQEELHDFILNFVDINNSEEFNKKNLMQNINWQHSGSTILKVYISQKNTFSSCLLFIFTLSMEFC